VRWAALAIVFSSATALARPNTPGSTDLFRFAAGETVESFASTGGHFLIWFTRAGTDAVPLDDANNDGTPDSVAEVAQLYEDVLAFYQSLGFRAPISDGNEPGDHGGDGRFDVYLLDFNGSSDGSFQREACDANNACTGYMVQENDFAGYPYPSRSYGNRVLASHEFFHAVQAAYDATETTIFSEGTAVWATERFDSTLSDLEGFVGGYLSRPDRSLYQPGTGPVDAFSYGASIFFQFLDEKFGDAIIRELWEHAVGAPDWFSQLDPVLGTHGSSFADAFFTFARWNWFTNKRANPMRGYTRGDGYPLVKLEQDPAPLQVASLRVFPASSAYFGVAPGGRASLDVALALPAGVDGSLLRLAAAARRGNVIDEPVLADAGLRLSVATDGVDELEVVVVNVGESGESTKPGLCVGSSDEVDACRAQIAPAPAPPAMPAAGGCTLAPAASPGLGAALFGFALLLALARRRRRW
jgi:hypothetical protein